MFLGMRQETEDLGKRVGQRNPSKRRKNSRTLDNSWDWKDKIRDSKNKDSGEKEEIIISSIRYCRILKPHGAESKKSLRKPLKTRMDFSADS